MYQSPVSLSEVRGTRAANAEIRAYCQSGQLFRDRYRITRVLGRGGFGVTYLAQDALLPGTPLCVIKQLCPKTQNPMSLERAKVRFRREARILANLGSHSQIPRLLDYFTLRGEFYLVQEFIQGQTLAQEIRRLGRQPERYAKQFLREILPVLQFIHRHRIIHRDIKPPNIIRCQNDNRLVLIDFGAVREFLVAGEEGTIQAPATQFVGTPGFAPPEQLAMRPCYASDIYALGMTCLYLLSGKTPIEFDTEPDTGEVLWQRYMDVSPHFGRILHKMLKPSLEERYQTLDDLERNLNLEPYLDTLSDCMNTRTSSPSQSEQTASSVVPMNQYTTPIQREAAAIRRWRSRRSGVAQAKPRTGFSTSKPF